MAKINEIRESVFSPKGVLDMDSGLRDVATNKGNYIMAQDIQHLPDGTNQEEFVINANGNTSVFTLPVISSQNKTYQITIALPATGTVNYSIGIVNINGSPHTITTFATQAVAYNDTLINDVIAFIASIATLLASLNPTVMAGAAPGTILITLAPTSITGWDYQIINNHALGTISSNPTVIDEAISQNLAGNCFPIGGYDYLDDLFILSSCQQKEATTFRITGATYTGGVAKITFNGDLRSYVLQYDEINLSGISGLTNNLNGNWIVDSIVFAGGITTIELYAAQTFTGTLSGTPIMTVNASGFLDISVFQYDVQSNAWTGTQLLDTKALNNRVYNPLTMFQMDENNAILALYFSDNNDTPRCIEYTGPYIADGCIQPIVPSGYYFYEGIDLASNFFNENATCTFDLLSVSNGGGNVASGNWKYAGCFLDASENPSLPSLLSNPVEVYSADVTQPNTVMGDTAGVATTKQVSLQVNDIPADTYPYFQLLGVNNVGGVETAYIIKKVSIPQGATSIQITHTGFEEYINYDAGLLDQQGAVYATVKTGVIVKNTFVIGNLTQVAVKDLTAFAQTIQHTVGKNTTGLAPIGDDVFGYKVGDYADPQATFNLVGYTDNETVRFGLEVELLNGTRTPAFWIDDVRFDNYVQSTLTITVTSGTFAPGDIVTQATSNATGIVISYAAGVLVLGVTSGTFNGTNNLTDSTSGATSTVSAVSNVSFNRAGIKGNRRLGSFASYDLSSNTTTAPQTNNSYVTYVNFSGIDMTTLIDGVPIYQFAKRLHIVRIDNISNDLQEILGCGISVRHVKGTITSSAGFGNIEPAVGGFIPITIYDNPFLLTGLTMGIFDVNNSTAVPTSILFGSAHSFSYGAVKGHAGNTVTVTSVLNGISFYCPDAYFNQTPFDPANTDEIINYGQPDFRVVVSGSPLGNSSAYDTFGGGTQAAGTIANAYYWSQFIKMSGSTNQSNVENNYISILGGSNVASFAGQVGYPDSTDYYSSRFSFLHFISFLNPSTPYTWDTPSKTLFKLGNNILQVNSNLGSTTPTDTNIDIGVYYTQYYRNKGSLLAYQTGQSKFGDITTGVYTTTGCFIDITNNDAATIDVYGGDTFTQQTFFKLRYPRVSSTDPLGYATGAGICVAFYCQNHFNWNMRNHVIPADTMAYPNYPLGSWLNNPIANPDNTNYDIGYTPQNLENRIVAFNPATVVTTDMYEREAYSVVKPQDSLTNNYRLFQPLDITDLSSNYGPITKLIEVQGELFSLQPKAFMRQFYNETGTLNLGDAASETEVVLGSGASFAKPPQLLSSNGCSNLFSILKGKGISGEDVIAWVDITNSTIMLFSPQTGVKDIGLEGQLRSFLTGAMKWITDDNPTLRDGITGVFNAQRKEFIWTFMGWKHPIEPWYIRAVYFQTGIVVQYGNDFNGVPLYYSNLVAGNLGKTPSTSPTYWEPISFLNNNFYSCFTLVYSLIKGGFTTFLTPEPYMYFAWTNTYLTPYPTFSYNNIFIADIGTPTTWYDVASSPLTSEAFMTWVPNDLPTVGKRWIAQWYSSLLTPFLTNYSTNVPSNLWNAGAIGNQASFLNAANFISKLNYFQANIQSDSTPTGSNTGMTGNLWGDYIISTLYFQTGVSQQFESAVTKYLPLHRNYTE